MSGSSFGSIFRITTWGESHGPGIGVVIDGCPAGIPISEADIQSFLDRRRPGQSKYTTKRNESDSVEILSGYSKEERPARRFLSLYAIRISVSRDYGNIATLFRPVMQTIRSRKNTVFGTIGAAAAHQGARQSGVWPEAQ